MTLDNNPESLIHGDVQVFGRSVNILVSPTAQVDDNFAPRRQCWAQVLHSTQEQA